MPFAQYGITIVIIYAVPSELRSALIVVVLHGLAHQKIPVPLSLLQTLFVGVVIVLMPIIAAILLWTPFERIDRWLFLGSITGALLFGVYNHLIEVSPDHISQIPFDGWGVVFQLTAHLLLVTEGIGRGVGVWALNPSRQKAL